MARIKVTNPHSGGFDYISSQRKISIPSYAKGLIVEIADDQVTRWLDQFSKDGLIAEQVKEQAAPPPEPAPSTSTASSSSKASSKDGDSGSKSTTSSKK